MGGAGRRHFGLSLLKFRLLPAALFASLALNLFLVGVISGGWRDLRGRPGPVTPPVAAASDFPSGPEAPVRLAPPPGGEAAQPSVRAPAPAPGRSPPVPASHAAAFHDPDGPADFPPGPPPGEGSPRGPGGNPLVRAARDLPGPERQAFLALLGRESEAVRADLRQARRERASAWRDLAGGVLTEEEAARRLEASRRRELSARGRVEDAVAEWAVRQSPDVRARIGQALAEDAQPGRRRNVRPPGMAPGGPGSPPPDGRGPEAGN